MELSRCREGGRTKTDHLLFDLAPGRPMKRSPIDFAETARGEDGDAEIARPTFVADLPNIRTGWLRFRENQAPERVIDPSLDRS